MSDYSDATEIARQQLSNISDTMCYAKWSQVSLHLTNGMTQSCYHPPVHQIDEQEIYHNPVALHNTEQKRREREQMLANVSTVFTANPVLDSDVRRGLDPILRFLNQGTENGGRFGFRIFVGQFLVQMFYREFPFLETPETCRLAEL